MSKGVLILEENPENCIGCTFNDMGYCQAKHNGEELIPDEDIDTKPKWCPIKPLPEKREVCGKYPQPDKIVPSYKIGWNDCIDKILEDK